MKGYIDRMSKAKVTDLKKHYPDLAPDKDYPPLKFKSLKGRVSAAEWEARVDCACAYRLVRHYDMHDLIYNHISARIPGTEEFLLNPFGLLYEEMCASSLIKVDLEGKVLWEPDWPQGLNYTFNLAGFVIHGAIHAAKPDVHCVIHTHSLAGMAVASLKKGVLPMTQTAMRFSRVAYHDYEGVVLEMDERKRLLENLGDCEVMLLRNHGTLAVGKTVGEAFNNMYRLERACRAQLLAQSADDEILLPAAAVIEKTAHLYKPGTRRQMGLLEWPAMRRLADRVERFAAWANDWRSKPVPPEVLHHAKRAVIDWHAALFPGAVMAPAILLEKALRDELDHGDATLALGRRATVRAAALINGTAAHTVEVDDIFRDGIYHPGAPTIAAALALARSHAVDGEKLLRAVIVGYEISTRIGAAMGRAHYRFWHNTGTIGSGSPAPSPRRETAPRASRSLRAWHDARLRAERVSSASRLPRRRSARRARRRHRLARCHRRRGRFRARDGRRSRLGKGARHAGARVPHHAHDVQEPRLLRACLRRHRRRARPPGEDGPAAGGDRARARRHLPRRPRGRALRSAAHSG